MKVRKLELSLIALILLALMSRSAFAAEPNAHGVFNVRAFGAVGDGTSVDTEAINRAIDAAHVAGGGTVFFPAGTYLSFSIRLKSNVTLDLESGATILAADPTKDQGRYDLPEPNEWDMYQDFGHSHWRNSLIWGIGLENVTIMGSGLIDGRGLTRQGPGPRRPEQAGDTPITLGSARTAEDALAKEEGRSNVGSRTRLHGRRDMEGQGNKAIALKLCRNVTLRDFRILRAGHFGVLATGVDNLTIDNLRIDTNRDGINVDCCRNVRISNCSINTPNDDALVLKSSFGLGFARATENATITNCQVSGYDLGTLLDGTFKRTQERAPDRDGVTGRIKFGTESNGGFKNIAISNCIFDHCRGLALEIVDGGLMENVSIANIVMRDIVNAPFFIRLGDRARGPNQPPVGAIRGVSIDNVIVSNADSRFASLISGIPDHPIEDVRLSNIHVIYKGGGTKEDAEREPPEMENAYPEPSMFGVIPAYGLFARHVRGLTVRGIEMRFMKEERRPAIVLHDVDDADLDRVKAQRMPAVPLFVLRDVRGFAAHDCPGVNDMKRNIVEEESF
jgi:polygalacturonase